MSAPKPAKPQISVFRPDRPGIRKALGDLESEVMELIWRESATRGATVREIYQRLRRRRPIAYTTVMTTMARLARKKLLRARKQGQAYVYWPRLSEEEFVSGLIGRFLEGLLVGFAPITIRRSLRKHPQAGRVRRLLADVLRRRAEETK